MYFLIGGLSFSGALMLDFGFIYSIFGGFPGGSVVNNLPANAGNRRDEDLISRSGRSPGVGNGNPFQYSCLENFMDRGAWWATACEVTKSGA